MKTIILENFKKFNGEHVFDLSELNIFTGGNNAGKSTVIKAINLLSKGLQKGDFPTIDLVNDEFNLGSFQEVLNKDTTDDFFGIGFYCNLGKVEKPFKVLYRFKDGEKGVFSESNGAALFYSMEITDINNDTLFAIYNSDIFKVTKENIEYLDYPTEQMSESIKYQKIPIEEIENRLYELTQLPFKSPYDHQDAGRIFMKINIKALKQYFNNFTKNNYNYLLDHLESIKGRHGNWWGEYFSEGAYDDYNFSRHSFNDFLLEMLKETDKRYYYRRDGYFNFAGEKLKFELIEDEDIEDEIKKYDEIVDYGHLSSFIREIVGSWFNDISQSTKVFKEGEIVHIKYEDISSRLISISNKTLFLRKLYNNTKNDDFKRFITFSYHLLNLFELNAYIEIKEHANSGYEINLVENVKLRTKTEGSLNLFLSEIDESENIENPRINISDMGKGLSNLILMITKVYSIININENKQSEEYISKNPKTILIEEPEVFLHPNWQSKLADMFVKIINENTNTRLIIETHSEYIIRRLQYLVGKKDVDAQKIKILYFNDVQKNKRHKKQFYQLKIREDGFIDKDFGKGFFDEASRLTIDLFKIQNAN